MTYLLDMMIAAIAVSHGLTLVTHNTGEFERVAGLIFKKIFPPIRLALENRQSCQRR